MIINGCKVEVFDDLPSVVIKELDDLLKTVKYTKTEASIQDSSGFTHWVAELNLEFIKGSKLFQFIEQKVPSPWELVRSYINSLSYGDQTFVHEDSDNESITVLVYIVDFKWLLDFGGETIYYDRNEDPMLTIMPQTGRYVVADGRIPHVGKPPNRYFIGERHTLALKFEMGRNLDG